MASWRIQGFVEDSEDEEDDAEEATEEGAKHECAVNEQTRTPTLEDEADKGFYLIDDFSDGPSEEVEAGNGPSQSAEESAGQAPAFAVVIEAVSQGFLSGQTRHGSSSPPLDDTRAVSPNSVSQVQGKDQENLEARRLKSSFTSSLSPHQPFDTWAGLASSTKHPFISPLVQGLSTANTSPSLGRNSSQLGIGQRETFPLSELEARPNIPQQNVAEESDDVHPTTNISNMAQRPRSLRKRNPIQLHPYLLESERYRQDLKARGVKPLRIGDVLDLSETQIQQSAPQDREFNPESDIQQEDESQVLEPADDSQLDWSTRDDSQPMGSPEDFQRTTHSSSPTLNPYYLEDFPEIDFLLSRNSRKVQRRGFKKRKLTHAGFGITSKPRGVHAVPKQAQFARQSKSVRPISTSKPRRHTSHNLPLSPPPSTNPGRLAQGPQFTSRASADRGASVPEPCQEELLSPSSANDAFEPLERSETEKEARNWPTPPSEASLDGSSSSGEIEIRPVAQDGKTASGIVPASWLSLVAPWQGTKAIQHPVQLESTTTRYRDKDRRPRFEARLADIDLQYEKELLNEPEHAKVPLERFLTDVNPSARLKVSPKTGVTQFSKTKKQQRRLGFPQQRALGCAKVHKDPVYLVDEQAIESGEPASVSAGEEANLRPHVLEPHYNQTILQGLGAFNTEYSVSFDIAPLEVGTFFHESTLIGAGELSKALWRDYLADASVGRGHVTIHLPSKTFRWAVWNEIVSSEIKHVLAWVGDRLNHSYQSDESGKDAADHQDITAILREVARYLSDALSFSDPIDRVSFVRSCSRALQELVDTLCSVRTSALANGHFNGAVGRAIGRAATVVLILAYQLYHVAVRSKIEPSLELQATELVKASAYHLIRALKAADLATVRMFYRENQRSSKRESGIRGDDYMVEGFVVAIQVLNRSEIPKLSFWEVVNEVLMDTNLATSFDARLFERSWESLFTILPLQEFDDFGVLQTGRRFYEPLEGWFLPKVLSSRLFAIYSSNPRGQSSSFNSYCRCVLSRCHYLITAWGWKKCEDIVGTLFDFFASNNLAHLKNEESYGSPQFLEELAARPDLGVQRQDRCFHILLKVIAVGLRALSRVYPDKKIRNIVFRLIPNHGRQYPKEEDVHQNDLDSLRNHHDLLCTLYWASPPSCRPSVNVIRDLVDAERSHREACRISLRAWVNLIRFQLSVDEPTSSLQPFDVWHSTLTMNVLKQHGLAKSEAEAQFLSKHATSGPRIASEVLKMTICQNQQQVEAILIEALVSIHNAIGLSRSIEAAVALLSKASTVETFSLFETRKRRTDLVVVRSLQVVKQYIRTCDSLLSVTENEQTNDDSQDYGDLTAFVEAVTVPQFKLAAEHLQNTVHDALARLLSNAFGSDTQPEETLLLELVDVWVLTARMLVSESLAQWESYTGPYSNKSWMNLRSTEQTRKYTAYFMSKVIEADSEVYDAHKSQFLSSWMASLVERDSMLKFQHSLTNAILNADRRNPLLKNLPFWFSLRNGSYSITAGEFSDRRLSLISSILTNMREAVEGHHNLSVTEASDRRQEYAQYLKGLMAAMKSNYRELQQGSLVSGAYVDFVQAVVEFLQHYTVDICPVDRFFTDSATFPLPARDPSYVVGRLKHYGLKLAGTSAPKQLSSFIQSVSERAAIDDQQSYLSMQLADAMTCTFEDGDLDKPTLRAFLMKAVFPAYIEYAFSSSAGWILAAPIMHATIQVFNEILQDIDTTLEPCVVSVASILDSFMETCRRSGKNLIERPGLLEQPSVLSSLSLLISVVTSCLSPLDYMARSLDEPLHSSGCIPFFSFFTTFIRKVLTRSRNDDDDNDDDDDYDDLELPSEIKPPPLAQTPYPAIRQFCAHELRETLTKSWIKHEDKYYLLRGTVRKHVVVRLGTFDAEKEAVLKAIEEFDSVLGRMRGLFDHSEDLWRRRRRRQQQRKRGKGNGETRDMWSSVPSLLLS